MAKLQRDPKTPSRPLAHDDTAAGTSRKGPPGDVMGAPKQPISSIPEHWREPAPPRRPTVRKLT
jgi:hypothetical protein